MSVCLCSLCVCVWGGGEGCGVCVCGGGESGEDVRLKRRAKDKEERKCSGPTD